MKAQPQPTADGPCPATTTPRLRALGIALFGDPATVDLRQRILNTIMLLAILTGVVATVQNIACALPGRMVAATLACAGGGAVGYWAARRALAPRLVSAALYTFYLIALAACWVTQAGSRGTIGYYFVLLICFAVILFHGPAKFVSLLLTGLTVAALIVVERYVPSAVVPYADDDDRFADVAMALSLCLSMVALVIHLVYREYQRERASKDAALAQMCAEKERVERAMREKQRLLTVVSHDIANALTVLQSEISLSRFADGEDKPSHLVDLERMAFACTNIGEIIGSVRMMEAMEQGRVAFEAKPVDLAAAFEYAEVIFGKRLAQRNMRFAFPELDDGNRFVMAEPRILANQVFGNLFSNAIKFSYPGATITVTVTRREQETEVVVIDHGIGIPASLADRLFDVEANVTRLGTDGEPGTGFGLRTVKHFVELFGGTLEIRSRPEAELPNDHGTQVVVCLRNAEAQE
jgi:signal transduction histidine kinase